VGAGVTGRLPLDGARCIVTGANSGIGREIATALARDGAAVTLVCRSRERGENAAAAIRGATGNPRVELAVCDVGDPLSVRTCCDALGGEGRVDVLVNNAGIYAPQRKVTKEGREQMLAVNHLGPFLMTNLLLERLDGARVITTSSMAHAFARLDLDDLDAARRFSSWRQYGVTKLANILFTRELARRAPGIVATCFHPGAVGSEFGQDEPGPMRVAMRLARPFLRTPARGADTGIWLATAPEAASLSGQYVVDRRVQTPRGQGADDTLAAELWRISERLVGLAP
jgi:NAD(P)-dependent dehydrogenase (short-subunit alcohol dehydrogenase family)